MRLGVDLSPSCSSVATVGSSPPYSLVLPARTPETLRSLRKGHPPWPPQVNVSRLDEVLSVVDEDFVQLVLDPQTNNLRVKSNEMTCTLSLINPRSIRQAPSQPDLEYPAMCQLEEDDLDLAVTAGKKVSDHLYVVVDEDQPELRFDARGDTDSVTYRREPGDLIAFEPAETASKFHLDHLSEINRALPSGPIRHLQIGDTIPLVVRAPLPDADGTVRFLLAPRTDD